MGDLVKRLRFGSLTTMGSHRMNLEAADRIEELEAQVRAADALADLLDEAVYILGQHRVTAPVVVEGRQAVTAYRATKEGGA